MQSPSFHKGRTLLFGLFFICLAAALRNADACTLWAATGASVEGKETLIVKNRDWAPDHAQEIRVIRPKAGYAYVALVATGGDEPGTKAGINEKGLVIVSATAGQLSRGGRDKAQQKPGLIKTLLADCASVVDVLKRLDFFRRPVFYLVGDKNTIAAIEVSPEGKIHVERRTTGTLAHTNHYRAADLQGVVKPPTESSEARLIRIEHLLKAQERPLTLDDFIRFSEDMNDGPDNSIWRSGSNPKKTRTLATWIARIPAAGSPELYLKIANPGRHGRICRLSLDDALFLRNNLIPLNGPLCTEAPTAE
ncbi:MAG TPA: C45 family autoproteolytic acyltransferase/hydrolase [Dissulfurispiraceae bacterium]|nr:C45 family autoproteolytic acyltransferase/hydrolase [Dissulfurispiraceae bacterium]